jgi:type I restriction enzyme, S subunit
MISPTLPSNWVYASLDEISEIIMGQSPPGETYNIEGIGYPLINGPVEFGPTPFSKTIKSKFTTDPKKWCNENDLILCVRGSTTGRMNIAGFDSSIGRGVAAIRSKINQNYLNYFIHSTEGFIFNLGTGSTFPNVTIKNLEELIIPIPPLSEQHRIVTKIEELLTQLDAGVASLKKVQAQLKRYRHAVLKAAFEGRLTHGWREEHCERDWQELILPNCCEKITKGESPKWQGFDYIDKGIPFIRSENVLWGKIDIKNPVKIPLEFHNKLKRSQVNSDDVLFNLVGASIGRCGIVPKQIDSANINQAVALIRCNQKIIPKYLMYLLLSPQIQTYIHSKKVETARANVSLEDLRGLSIKLPSYSEQVKIITEIERHFSQIDHLESTITTSLLQAESLRQSILKHAFEGKLVPQDPNDEPALILLERIKAEKAHHTAEKLKGKTLQPKSPKRKIKNVN